ncbi:orotate phosphoribosyltransferase [Legionella sp. PATHC032]|uniref:orotate phosphoribosyltransferase n=1 Tax=Legionella sp. PATHC032 TaxID=2992039 RepID=UPI001B15ABC2|nr:orotate phosphoribosyltransferase [Legionella sp. PATHC032]MCW8421128.1 orotate phosphoribosyltransferase [Legionella sp. PATHC032]HAZ7573392.1 orotate phosphoribosyltransferase [Legionella pneumophila]HBA1634427.1 orotate phosphoribosyltransferase [Legionella pneumophila]
MNHTKSSFIKLALECQVLKFGEFTLKSGRISPYFFNAGLFYHGNSLRQLGQFYAKTLLEQEVSFEHLFGPAYKGIPLATSTAVALAELGKDITVTFNRKEIKTHGEGGQLIGSPLTGRTVIIDDVITAGTAFRESQTLIKENGGILHGVIIALDRCERGLTEKSTLSEIRAQGIEVYSIINLFDLIEFLKNDNQCEQVQKLESYHERYGAY